MKRSQPRSYRSAAGLAAFGCALICCPALAAPLVEQSLELRPGWNAVYLEVAPEPGDVASVFAGLPIGSVWTWIGRGSTVAFIQDPAEGLRDQPGWLGHFPAGRPESFLGNLAQMRGGQAYLVQLQGTQPRSWTVRGRPAPRPPEWAPNSFNLVGFPLDPAAPPTFSAFFAASAAHAGQAVYRLGTAGQWERLSDLSTAMRPGEAFWIYTAGRSDYRGPLAAESDGPGGLDFGGLLREQQLRIRKRSGNGASIRVRRLASENPVALLYRSVVVEPDPESAGHTRTVIRWPALPQDLSMPAAPGQEVFLRLAVQRAAFTADKVESVLEISDGSGARVLVPVAARRAAARSARSRGAAEVHELAGPWVGTATVNRVSEARQAGTVPEAADSEFHLRLLVHVDAAGRARLLKEVVQLWQDGDSAADPPVPGRPVLLTDPARFEEFGGSALRDGEMVGRRISSATLDFDAASPSYEPASRTLLLEGSFAPGGQLSCQIALEKDHPTNPFRHKFHPDHDNLDALYVEPRDEAPAVHRLIELGLSLSDPFAPDAQTPWPGWGSTLVAGTYRETFPAVYEDGRLVAGLHRNTIVVEGRFQLRRVSGSAVELNPQAGSAQ